MNKTLQISDSQMSVFQEDSKERYVLSLVKFLKEEIPGAADDNTEYLFHFVESMVKKAEIYGLTTKRDAAVYVATAYMLGEDFEENFHVTKQTLISSLPGPDKAKKLQETTIALINSRGRPPQ